MDSWSAPKLWWSDLGALQVENPTKRQPFWGDLSTVWCSPRPCSSCSHQDGHPVSVPRPSPMLCQRAHLITPWKYLVAPDVHTCRTVCFHISLSNSCWVESSGRFPLMRRQFFKNIYYKPLTAVMLFLRHLLSPLVFWATEGQGGENVLFLSVSRNYNYF